MVRACPRQEPGRGQPHIARRSSSMPALPYLGMMEWIP